MRTLHLSLALTLAFAAASSAQAPGWSRFRGPNGSGVAANAASLPVEFGPGRNVAWKAKVPFGQSSPIVAPGGRVIVTASDSGKLITFAYDAATGKELWRAEAEPAHRYEIYKANDPASPTPAADEAGNVYVFFPGLGLVSYEGATGKERWRHALGPFENFYGMSSSPVVAPGGLVLLLCDQQRNSFLLALDRVTGQPRWKAERPGSNIGWSVPVVKDDQILVFGSTRVESYHLSTGEPRWWTPLNSNGSMGTPVLHGDTMIVTAAGGDQPWLPSFAATAEKVDKDGDKRLSVAESKDEKDWVEHFGWVDADRDGFIAESEWNAARDFGVGGYGAVAIALDGKGRLDASAVRWRFQRNLPYVPAPIALDGVLYMIKSGGILTSLDATKGTLQKQGRTPDAGGEYWASPVAGDGKLYVLSGEGKLSVLRAGAQWESLATNDLGEECFATPAIDGGRLFVRTRSTLYAFAAPTPKPAPRQPRARR